MTIKDIIIKYSDKLKDISDTPRLDTELLLQKTLGVDRLYIHLNLNKELTEEQNKIYGFCRRKIKWKTNSIYS